MRLRRLGLQDGRRHHPRRGAPRSEPGSSSSTRRSHPGGSCSGSTTGSADWAQPSSRTTTWARCVESVTADVSTSIADGNVLVFAELAPLFTALLEARARQSRAHAGGAVAPRSARRSRRSTATQDAGRCVDAFRGLRRTPSCAARRAGRTWSSRPTCWRWRTSSSACSRRSTLALNAAITDTLKKLIENDVVDHVPTQEARRALDGLTDELCQVLDKAWDTALTESIMQLVTTTETFDLRQDVPPLPDGMFPPELRTSPGLPAEPPRRQWDKTGGTGRAVRRPRLGRPGRAHELHRQPVPLAPARRRPSSSPRSPTPSWPLLAKGPGLTAARPAW